MLSHIADDDACVHVVADFQETWQDASPAAMQQADAAVCLICANCSWTRVALCCGNMLRNRIDQANALKVLLAIHNPMQTGLGRNKIKVLSNMFFSK